MGKCRDCGMWVESCECDDKDRTLYSLPPEALAKLRRAYEDSERHRREAHNRLMAKRKEKVYG